MKGTWTRAIVTVGLLGFVAGCNGLDGVFSGLGGFFGGSGDSSEIVIVSAENLSDSASVSGNAGRLHNPEPTSLALFGLGLAGLARSRRRRNEA